MIIRDDANPTETGIAASLRLWVILARTFQAIGAHARSSVERHGLTPGSFAVLEVLYSKGPLLLGQIQKKVLVSSGGITYLVDRLEEKGLVERRRCETDRRALYAALTEEGRALMDSVFPEHAQALERAMAGLDTEEKEVAAELLKRLGHHAARAEE